MSPLLSGLLVGIAFGAILWASGLSNPRLITNMLRLRDLWLLKVLVTALAIGIVGVALLASAGAAHTSIKPLHVLALVLGGAIFGVGFAISGYCPGTSLAAAAEGRRDAFFTILGGLAGTAAFAGAYAWLLPRVIEPMSYGKPTLFSWLGVPALAVALPIGAGAAILIGRWWRTEHPSDQHRIEEAKQT
jgi:uncharacterized protein